MTNSVIHPKERENQTTNERLIIYMQPVGRVKFCKAQNDLEWQCELPDIYPTMNFTGLIRSCHFSRDRHKYLI